MEVFLHQYGSPFWYSRPDLWPRQPVFYTSQGMNHAPIVVGEEWTLDQAGQDSNLCVSICLLYDFVQVT